MSQPTIKIPLPGKHVTCEKHGSVPGYIVCSCVSKFQEKPTHIFTPKNGKLGEILCQRVKDHEQFELVLICEKCAKDRGFLDGMRKIREPKK